MEFSFAYSNPILATFLVILFFVSFFLSQKRRRQEVTNKPKQAPSPAGAWPVLGHLPLLRTAKLPHVTLGAMADHYGPIFTLRLGSRSALVVSNWEMAKESMCVNDAAAASRPKLSGLRQFTYDFALFGLAPYGPYWREMRKITHLELLSNQRVEQVQHTMFSEVDMSLRELCGFWAAKREGGSDWVLVDLKSWFGDLILNILLKIIIGKRCVGPKAEGGGEEEAKRLRKAVRDTFVVMGQSMVRDYIPTVGILQWFDFDGKEKVANKLAKEIDGTLRGWLEEHKAKKLDGLGLNEKDGDFMGALRSLLEGKLMAGYDGDTIIKATTLNMIAGGSESSTVTLTWAVSLLLNNPHTLEKAYRELDEEIGRDRRVNESDINKLVYLQAIVKEAMRLYPAGPLLGPREFCQDCTVAGYFVPKGTQLIPNIWKIQRDPEVWPDPEKFDPDRFLTTHKNVDLKGNNFELIPFGSGRRGCPGISFGLQMVHFALAGFLQSFQIKTPAGGGVDMSENFGLANEKATPLDVLITPRLPSHL